MSFEVTLKSAQNAIKHVGYLKNEFDQPSTMFWGTVLIPMLNGCKAVVEAAKVQAGEDGLQSDAVLEMPFEKVPGSVVADTFDNKQKKNANGLGRGVYLDALNDFIDWSK